MGYIKKTRIPKEHKKVTGAIMAALVVGLIIILIVSSNVIMGDASTPASSQSVEGGEMHSSPIVINEVMSSNGYSVLDDNGEFSDWIELYNTGTNPVSLKGMGLSDRETSIKYVFPDVTIGPDSYMIIYASGKSAVNPKKPLHVPFKISSKGETIYLFDSTGFIIDKVECPAMVKNTSYVRDESGTFDISYQPSPGYPNTTAGYAAYRAESSIELGAIRLNEISPRNRSAIYDEDGDASDWIELINESDHAVSLEGYSLSDDESKLSKWRFPKGSTIPANGVLLVFASGKNRPATGSGATSVQGEILHTNFKLNGTREVVLLSNSKGQLVDHTIVENIPKDASWARVPGLSVWEVVNFATPGQPNTRAGQDATDAAMRQKSTSGLLINEACSYASGMRTPQGVTSFDWVEILNTNDYPVSLLDYGLSDSPGKPRKWQFPDVTIQPGQYLLVFLSGSSAIPKDSASLHAPLKLSSLGEIVTLSDPSGHVIDRLVLPALSGGTSYGRAVNGGLAYFDLPTPGAKNNQGFAGYAPKPVVDTPGGMYPSPINVSIRVASGTTVRYTTDGKDPTEDSPKYDKPIPIEHTTVLRVRSYQDGLRASAVVTNTYFISVYHTLPVVSVVVDPYLLYNPINGVMAGDYRQSTKTKMPYSDLPYWQKERVLGHFEFIDASGIQRVSENIEFMLNGQFSMDMPQKSFRISAKPRYGSSALAYPFFDYLPDGSEYNRPYTSYNALVLRNGGQDGNYTRIIDGMQSRIMDWSNTTVYHMPWRPVVMYLNGEYWGQYNLRERINTHALAQYEGWSSSDNIDLIKGSGTIISGTIDNYRATRNYIRDHDLNNPDVLAKALDMIDVENIFDYYIFEIYFGNTDAGNIKFYRRNAPGEKWRWIVYDLDWGMFDSARDGCAIWLDPNGAGSLDYDNIIIRKLLSVPHLRKQFLQRFGDLFQNVFVPERMNALAKEMAAEIEPEMSMHFSRWSNENSWALGSEAPKSPEGAYAYWKSRLSRLENVINKRNHMVWGHVQDWFKLSDEQMTLYFGARPPLP